MKQQKISLKPHPTDGQHQNPTLHVVYTRCLEEPILFTSYSNIKGFNARGNLKRITEQPTISLRIYAHYIQ